MGKNNRSVAPMEMLPQVLDQVNAPIDRGEVLRYLGYPVDAAPSRAVCASLEQWIAEAESHAQPRAVFAIFSIEDIGNRFLRLQTADGTTEFCGAIGEYLGMSRKIAAFIATAGPKIGELASRLLKSGDNLAAMIVSAVGSERAEAAEMAVIEQLRANSETTGLMPTLPYSPGYCGIALTEQVKLFDLFGGQTAGVRLTPECLMQPLKSVSGLIGLAFPEDVAQNTSPCDRCELHTCEMRRESC